MVIFNENNQQLVEVSSHMLILASWKNPLLLLTLKCGWKEACPLGNVFFLYKDRKQFNSNACVQCSSRIWQKSILSWVSGKKYQDLQPNSLYACSAWAVTSQ